MIPNNMKSKSRLLLLSFVSLLCGADAKEINILFMGNSFTFRHDLPELVKQVFEEGQPGLTVNVERIVYGGQDLFRHHDLYFSETFVRLNSITPGEIEDKISAIESMLSASSPPEFYDAYWRKTGLPAVDWEIVERNLQSAVKRQQQLKERIESGDRVKWDYIVLQSWRDVVSDVNAGYCEYAKKFAAIAAREGAGVILYITAPLAQNEAPVSEPVGLEQTRMELQAIRQLAQQIKPRAVVPVAIGLRKIQQDGTSLKFRYVNDMHPNQYCAFLTSNMFYAACFRESTVGFHYDTVTETNPKGKGTGKDPDGGDATIVFEPAVKELLQQTAFEAVMEFYSQIH